MGSPTFESYGSSPMRLPVDHPGSPLHSPNPMTPMMVPVNGIVHSAPTPSPHSESPLRDRPSTSLDIQKSQQQEVEEINTKELAQRISSELKRYSIPQAVFAQRVLCRSQGTLSDLLRNPKPWSKLKSGRETFRRMWKWLQEPEFQRMSALRLAGNAPLLCLVLFVVSLHVDILQCYSVLFMVNSAVSSSCGLYSVLSVVGMYRDWCDSLNADHIYHAFRIIWFFFLIIIFYQALGSIVCLLHLKLSRIIIFFASLHSTGRILAVYWVLPTVTNHSMVFGNWYQYSLSTHYTVMLIVCPTSHIISYFCTYYKLFLSQVLFTKCCILHS